MSLSLVVDDPKKEDTKGVGCVSECLLFVCLFFLESNLSLVTKMFLCSSNHHLKDYYKIVDHNNAFLSD